MPAIIRILHDQFGLKIDNASLADFDIFMEKFGKSISMELIMMIYDSMCKNINNDEPCNDYKIEIRVEKSLQFEIISGEFIC